MLTENKSSKLLLKPGNINLLLGLSSNNVSLMLLSLGLRPHNLLMQRYQEDSTFVPRRLKV